MSAYHTELFILLFLQPRTFIAFVKNDDSSSVEYLWRDVVGMSQLLGTEPICVDAIEGIERLFQYTMSSI